MGARQFTGSGLRYLSDGRAQLAGVRQSLPAGSTRGPVHDRARALYVPPTNLGPHPSVRILASCSVVDHPYRDHGDRALAASSQGLGSGGDSRAAGVADDSADVLDGQSRDLGGSRIGTRNPLSTNRARRLDQAGLGTIRTFRSARPSLVGSPRGRSGSVSASPPAVARLHRIPVKRTGRSSDFRLLPFERADHVGAADSLVLTQRSESVGHHRVAAANHGGCARGAHRGHRGSATDLVRPMVFAGRAQRL